MKYIPTLPVRLQLTSILLVLSAMSTLTMAGVQTFGKSTSSSTASDIYTAPGNSTTSQRLKNVANSTNSSSLALGRRSGPNHSNSTRELKRAIVWKNGDILCNQFFDHERCGRNAHCIQTEHSNYKRTVCVCIRTYLPMTIERKCPGKISEDNNPWPPVECTHNHTICGNLSTCMRTEWFSKGSPSENNAYCFCTATMEPMRANFTCPPLSRFDEKKRYPPIPCVTDDEKVCGPEAFCMAVNESNPSAKFCWCPDTDEPVGGNGLKCPREIIQEFDLDVSKVFTESPKTTQQRQVEVLRTTTTPTTPTTPKTTKTTQANQSEPHLFASIRITELLLFGALMLTFALLGVFLFKYYLRRSTPTRYHSGNKAVPIRLPGIILPADRFIRNPLYADDDLAEDDVTDEALSAVSVQLISRDRISALEEIGEGHFGKVFKGQLREAGSDHQTTVAIKTLKRNTSRAAEDELLQEVETMNALRHENILSVIGFCARDGRNAAWMVFEFMTFGDLVTILRGNSHPWLSVPNMPRLSPRDLFRTAYQVALGMEYLAQHHFVHRDLACRNCLVGENMVVKIADFGMSRDIYNCDYYRVDSIRQLPVRWTSPESLMCGKFTLESDIWSYGVLLWEIFTYGKQPYYGYSNEQVLEFIANRQLLEIPKQCPSEVASIMKSCWRSDPRKRIAFKDITERFRQSMESGPSVVEQRSVEKSKGVAFSSRLYELGLREMSPAVEERRSSRTIDEVAEEDGYLKPC